MTDEQRDLDEYYSEVHDRAMDAMMKCDFRTAARLNGDVARGALANGFAMHYISGRFHEMDQTQYTLEFETTRQAAIELIAVLEDEDRARAIQPEFPQGYYEHTQQWMTACVYENLAEATGMTDGYNSPGMQQCIGDGIQVCRRTGKMECISCFREYASDVYLASDDLLMARNQCEMNIARESGWSNRGDRRWFASMKAGWISLLEGRLDLGLEKFADALKLCEVEGVSLKMESRLKVLGEMDTALILSRGERADWSVGHPEGQREYPLEPGHWPALDFKLAMSDAVEACCQSRPKDALEILHPWDRTLLDNHCTHYWFELRLRMIAAMLLAGDAERGERVAAQLREKATAMNDFLTLRRLDLLFDESFKVNPIASLEPLNAGPFADASAAQVAGSGSMPGAAPATDASAAGDPGSMETDDEDDEEPTEYQTAVMGLVQMFFTTEDPAERQQAVEQYLSLTPDMPDTPEDAGFTLHFGSILGAHAEPDERFWTWAKSYQEHYRDDPSILSMVAVVGDALAAVPDSPVAALIDEDELLKLHQLALSMDANRVGNYLRAGEFYMSRENEGEAERCLARAFRLDRTCVPAALQLSEIYSQSERYRDAMEVLDICLREGADDPNLAMEATTLSLMVGQYEATLTYADQVVQFAEEDPAWVDYYRALALLELERIDEALAALDAELRHEHANTLHVDLARTACLLAAGNSDAAINLVQQINTRRMSEAEQLTLPALSRLTAMVWFRLHESDIPASHPERQRYDQTLLATGLMPDAYFELQRTEGRPIEDVPEEELLELNCYGCILRQEVDAGWAQSNACLAGQQNWDAYIAMWTVLAVDEQKAAECALAAQSQCCSGPCEVLEVALESGPYRDVAGVASQGMHWPAAGDDEE